jgi:integrase
MPQTPDQKKLRGIYEYPPKSKEWWIQYFDAAGRRRREKAGRRGDAIDLLAKRKVEKLRGIKLPERMRKKSISFGELMDDAIEHSKAENGEATTAELKRKYALIRQTFGNRPATEIQKAEIVRWLTEQGEKRDWEPATRNRWQNAFSLAFRVGIDNERIEKNPASRIRRNREDNGRLRILDRNEEQKLIDILNRDYPEYRPAFIISVNTGVRASEQWRADWLDVDLERRIFTVRKTKNGEPERHVPLNSTALGAFQELGKACKGKGPVFLNTEGNPLRGHRDWFEPVVKAAKLNDYTWHCNRHTFASRLVMAGVDLRTVAQLMGHKTIQMTMRYAHLAPDHQQNAVERIVNDTPTGKVKQDGVKQLAKKAGQK